jgi:hypothetical protein
MVVTSILNRPVNIYNNIIDNITILNCYAKMQRADIVQLNVVVAIKEVVLGGSHENSRSLV